MGQSHADEKLESTLQREFEQFAADRGVKAKLVIDVKGNDTRAESDGTITVGLAPLSRLDPKARLTSMRFYLAHELWHQRQYQIYGFDAVKSTPEKQRLYECQADLMAAEQIVRNESIDTLPIKIKDVANLAYSIGVPFHLHAEHPSQDQRQTAVKYGITFGITNDRFSPQWQNEFGNFASQFVSKLRKQIGFQEGMDVETWALQQCKMVTHYSNDALSGIAISSPVIRFNRDPNAPFVYYNIPYKNISSRKIRLAVAIQSILVYRKNPKDLSKRSVFAMENYEVDIAPGETFKAAGTLPWYGDKDDYYPALEFQTNSPFSLVAAEYIGEESEELTCLGSSLVGKTQLAKDLHKALTKLAQSADSGFKPFRSGTSTVLSDTAYYTSTLQLPEATETEIVLEQEGAARVSATLYEGGEQQEAVKTYDRYRNAILETCPIGIKFKEKNQKRGPDLTLPFSRKTQINLYVYGNPEKGVHRVLFNLNATKWQ